MITNLNISDLKSKIVTLKNVPDYTCHVSYIDHTFSNTQSQFNQYGTVSSNLYNKHIKLNYIDFVDSFDPNILLKNIEKDFLIEAQKLGYKNRESLDNKAKFDIILKSKHNKEDSERIFFGKLDSINNYFSIKSRLGGFGFLASNFATYMNIRTYLRLPFEYISNDETQYLNGIPYIINNHLDDDVILVGRKNSIEQPGAHCFVKADNKGFIDVDSIETLQISYFSNTKICRLYYKVDNLGVNPENQYFIINTSDLQSIRCKKLNKIKELYGE